jgi:hypothetical protein
LSVVSAINASGVLAHQVVAVANLIVAARFPGAPAFCAPFLEPVEIVNRLAGGATEHRDHDQRGDAELHGSTKAVLVRQAEHHLP